MLLASLIQNHLQTLSGAEFKVAVYLYWRLQKEPEVITTVKGVAEATGLSPRRTQFALARLNQQGILRIESRQNHGTSCRLPAFPEDKTDKTMATPAAKSSLTMTPPPLPNTAEPVSPPFLPSIQNSPQTQPGICESGAGQERQEQEIKKLIRTLMDWRHDITPADLHWILVNASAEPDVLLARLRSLIPQKRIFDSLLLLCAELRRIVWVR